jgi:hypothetical protein
MRIDQVVRGMGLWLALGAAAGPMAAQGTGRQWLGPARASAQDSEALGQRLARLARKLDLDETRQTAWLAAYARHKDGLDQAGQAVRSAANALREALDDPDSAPEGLKALNRTLGDLEFAFLMEARALRQELGALLTARQREQAVWMERRLLGPRQPGHGQALGNWDQGDPEQLTVFAPGD